MMSIATTGGELNPSDDKFLDDAVDYLEHPSLLTTIANAVGWPLEKLVGLLDKITPDVVEKAVNAALRSAVSVAVQTIPAKAPTPEPPPDGSGGSLGVSADLWHKLSVAATGTVGGLFGLPGLAIELPVSTTIMLRSIASTAQERGESLDDPEVRLQCLAVLAHGGPSSNDDALECSYLTSRIGLQVELREAVKFVAKTTAAELANVVQSGAAPVFARLIAMIAAQFNIAVTQKLVAQSIPIVGAVGGAAVNVAFIDHFNRVAAFHFGIRQLERKYGLERVQAIYRSKTAAIKQLAGPAGPIIGTT